MEWMLEDRRPEGCRLEGFEPLTCWTIAMDGPEGCPGLPSIYQGQTFRYALCSCVELMCGDFWGGSLHGEAALGHGAHVWSCSAAVNT